MTKQNELRRYEDGAELVRVEGYRCKRCQSFGETMNTWPSTAAPTTFHVNAVFEFQKIELVATCAS